MKACKNCRHGDAATDGAGAAFYWCRLTPGQALVLSGREGQEVIWQQPAKKPDGWCGQFRLAFFRWLANFGRRS